MAEIKAHEFEGRLGRMVRDQHVFLVFGPDRGLVSERARALANATGIDLSDPFSLIRLDGEDLSGDPGRLSDEARSMGLFGGDKLVWLRAAGTEKHVIDGVSGLLSGPLDGVKVVIEAGDLKKGTGLRKLVEGAQAATGIPCYADDARALQGLIDEEMNAAGLAISQAARQKLASILGGDRIASRNELKKLALYAMGEGRVEERHVDEIVGDASAISTDDAVDCVLSGDADGFVHAMQKVIASKTAPFLVLQGALRQLQLIDLMRAEIDAGSSPAAALQTHGRFIFFKRKPIIERALSIWSAERLAVELNRLQGAVLSSRQNAANGDAIAMQALLATTLQSRKR